jgi:hypothetical protein
MTTIPPVDRVAVEDAIARFNRGERSEHWRDGPQGWRADQNHKYAVAYGGELFPMKEIIRLALANSPNRGFSDFSGGRQANRYLRAHGFEIVALQPDQPVP